jgi:EthD domain
MEKVICALWGPSPALLQDLPTALAEAGAKQVRINVQHETVSCGAPLRQTWQMPQQDAVVQYWVPSANPIFHEPVLEIVARHCRRVAAWLVSESTIIPNVKHPPVDGERTDGWAQMAFLTLPKGMSLAEWRAIWRDYHTSIAINTQANFEYVQNFVVEPLTPDAPPYVGIVEECFPLSALTDPFVFFDAVGDPDKFQRNLDTMMESCGRFIEPGTIDVIPTSQFNFA